MDLSKISSDLASNISNVTSKIDTDFTNWQGQQWPERATTPSYINVGKWERVASALLGGFLLFRAAQSAVKNPKITNLLSGAIGGALVQRGATGHCALYDAGKISTAKGAIANAGEKIANKLSTETRTLM